MSKSVITYLLGTNVTNLITISTFGEREHKKIQPKNIYEKPLALACISYAKNTSLKCYHGNPRTTVN